MKLLLVDDEALTREGVIASIDWEKLGITEIYQAEDGVEGLSLAKKYAPEIVLCDVRMPRMTGIEMMEKIQSLYPDTVSIFMSGYSDKEYLKAAIKLHSINYVEKPLDITEIEMAVIDAIARYKLTTRSHQNETKRKIQDASSLALTFTLPENERDNEQIQRLIKELHLPINSSTFFTTWIIKFPYAEQLSASFFSQIAMATREYLKKYKMQMLHVRKHVQYLIFHVFGNFSPSSIFTSGLEGFLTGSCQSAKYFFIARGSTVVGVHNVYSSYQKAVLLLQSSFFFHNQSILTVDSLKKYTSLSSFSSQIPDFMKSFSEALNARDKGKCDLLLIKLLKYYERNMSLLPNEAKDMYYRLFMLLQEAMLQSQIPSSHFLQQDGNIISYLEKCTNIYDLSATLQTQMDTLFTGFSSKTEENSTIFLIKEYIANQYTRESLSVKDISDHVYLSTSYVCTLFKTETGQTLNQYITEYRINKAKQLLRDPRYKITEISSRVGYADSNYFGKIFKKCVGFSPSEYRKAMI